MRLSVFVQKFLTPFIYINAALMAGSGLWLLSGGAWGALWSPILFLMISPFLFPIVLFPAAFLSGMMQLFDKKNPLVARGLMVATLGYFILFLSFYALFVYHLASDLFATMMIPAAVWTVTATAATWGIFATRDRENIFFSGLVMMLEVAVFIATLLVVFQGFEGTGFFWMTVLLLSFMVSLEALYEKYLLK